MEGRVKQFENRSLGDTSAASKNSTSPMQKQPTDEWIDEWIDEQECLISFQETYGSSSTKRVLAISQIQKQSIDLKVSLQMFLQEATTFTDRWNDVNISYDDRRSFPTFLWMLQDSGMDWNKYIVPEEDNDSNVSNQLKRWSSLQAPPLNDVVHLHPELTSELNWVMANKYYGRSLYLTHLLQKIQDVSPDVFSQDQARKLELFLGDLIMIQHEQRVVAYSFSKHLEQLRQFDAASSLAYPSVAVDYDGDKGQCPLICSKHAMEYYMWQQKHLFDSLYIISRESTWLLMKLKNSRFTSPLFVEESQKIIEMIVPFISKFKKSKELLGHHLDNLIGVPEDEMTQMVQENKEILDNFGNHIECLQEKCVGKGSVIEYLLVCLGDVCKISLDEYGEKNTLSNLYVEYKEAVQETLELVEEARKKLNPDSFSNLNGGSPLGNITLWRILFESSVVDLRLDHICKKHGEAIKFGVRLLSEENSHPTVLLFVQKHLNRIHAEISLLLSDGDRVLLDFAAMHRTVAEITYMLGDAFTTGGAGMKDLSDETSSAPESSSKSDEEKEMGIILDFPWDKHNVPPIEKIDLSDPNRTIIYDGPSGDEPCPEDDDEFI
ncbi:hypothetical protein MKW94_003961 [Papaver nudicaule]|uniref:Uncharacterized protein n=1 Tax=Papaver nudicaule TaxID=74823 RepID=A0AA41RS60_PAPNU|nr:hypothetical protein [Papaver nudicaule]